jgi:plastocyanin
MKMKKAKWLVELVLAGIIALTLVGCASTGGGSGKDFGVLDNSVPASEQAELQFRGIIFKTINGQTITWQNKMDMRHFDGVIKIPAGNSTFVFDYHWETTELMAGGAVVDGRRTAKQTIKEAKDLVVTAEIQAGNRYFLSCSVHPDGTAIASLLNTTNMLSTLYGDKIPKAPKASTTPTAFEGEWVSPEGAVYKFAGNTWEMTAEASGFSSKQKGVFTIADKLNMYTTHLSFTKVGDKVSWIPTSQVLLNTYSFEDGNLLLEVEGISPQVVYTKR